MSQAGHSHNTPTPTLQLDATRRRLLGAAAVVTAAVLPPPALAASVADDAELIDLGRQIEALYADERSAIDQEVAAYERYDELLPEPPLALKFQYQDHAYVRGPCASKTWCSDDADRIREALTGHRRLMAEYGGLNARAAERCEEILAALAAYEPQKELAEELSGRREARMAANAISGRLSVLERRVFELRASTIAGLRTKALIARRYTEPTDGSFDAQSLHGMITDLLGAL